MWKISRATIVSLLSVFAFQTSVRATDFPVVGGSYNTNVALRVNAATGSSLASAIGTFVNDSVQFGTASNLIDGSGSVWAIQSMADSTSTATAVVTLDQVYDINKIGLNYGDSGLMPATEQVRVSDGTNWAFVEMTAPAGTKNLTFSMPAGLSGVKQIEWQITGPGTSGYGYMAELSAFVSSDAASPQKEDGYDLAQTMTIVSQTGWSGVAGAMIDGNPTSYAVAYSGSATADFSLGAPYALQTIKTGFYPGQTFQNGGLIEISLDDSNWTTVASGDFGSGTFVLPHPVLAEYVRVVANDGSTGAVESLEVFAEIPEPASGVLLALGGVAMLRRRR